MRFWAKCGICEDEEDIRGIDTMEVLLAVKYAFWARHDHVDWQFRMSVKSKGGAYAPAPVFDDDGGGRPETHP